MIKKLFSLTWQYCDDLYSVVIENKSKYIKFSYGKLDLGDSVLSVLISYFQGAFVGSFFPGWGAYVRSPIWPPASYSRIFPVVMRQANRSLFIESRQNEITLSECRRTILSLNKY